MKLDLSNELFHSLLGLASKAPVPWEVSNPIIQAVLAQSQDARIQSLQYPADKAEEFLHRK